MHNKSSKNGSERFWPTAQARDYRSVTGREHLQRENAMQNLNVAAVYSQRSTPTSSPSTEPTTPGLTCSQVDFLANLSVSPGSEEARQMTVRSSQNCIALLKSQSPLGSCLKMLLGSSRWNSTITFLTWKASATKSGRVLFCLRPQSAHPTAGTECGSSGEGLWRTPTTADHKNMDYANQVYLCDQVKMWPTPTSRDHKDGTAQSCANVEENGLLGRVVHSVPGPPNPTGSLNPQFVEWLMGYPIGHTACADWATPSSRKSLKKSSETSSIDSQTPFANIQK